MKLETVMSIAHWVQIAMAIVYTIRVIWLLSFKAGKERQPKTGSSNTTPRKGFLYSWAIIGIPWAMESTRKHFFLYIQFVIFHLGVAAAIGLTFLIPYAEGLMAVEGIKYMVAGIIGASALVGFIRIIRRIASKYMRAISTPDDYFSLIILTVWLSFGSLSALIPYGEIAGTQFHLYAFFIMTTFFLIYVPFSKISHYLYYPFTRYYFGKSMGKRGVYPLKPNIEPNFTKDKAAV